RNPTRNSARNPTRNPTRGSTRHATGRATARTSACEVRRRHGQLQLAIVQHRRIRYLLHIAAAAGTLRFERDLAVLDLAIDNRVLIARRDHVAGDLSVSRLVQRDYNFHAVVCGRSDTGPTAGERLGMARGHTGQYRTRYSEPIHVDLNLQFPGRTILRLQRRLHVVLLYSK